MWGATNGAGVTLKAIKTGAEIPRRVHSRLAISAYQIGSSGMNQSYLLSLLIAGVLVAGCTATAPNSAEPQAEKRTVTGSRIPARDGNTSAAVQSIENKEGIDEALRNRSVVIPGKGGTQ
jgi:hypothetical protein